MDFVKGDFKHSAEGFGETLTAKTPLFFFSSLELKQEGEIRHSTTYANGEGKKGKVEMILLQPAEKE